MPDARIELTPLIPKPRHAQSIEGKTDLAATASVTLDPVKLTKPCEHIIRAADCIEIIARDEEALRSARITLKQIAACSPSYIGFEIHDWAQFENRGFMLDVSRDRIPTMEHLESLVEMLASLKYNHLQLYFEHTFAYEGHQQIWDGLEPITHDQIRALDLFCKKHGIELAANQNCFGHLSHLLTYPDYAHLAETHGEYDFYGYRRRGPYSLNPSLPGSLELVNDWIQQLRTCHSSNLFNIGCDEVADLGTGCSKELVIQLGYARVYSQFVTSIAERCAESDFRPMFWADVAMRFPESLEMLPDDLIALVWGYEPDSPFEESLKRTSARGMTAWVCPGTSCWRSFAGRTTERKANITNAASAGSSHGCKGFLLTSWGDLGHRQQWPITLRALADGASAAWSGGDLADPEAVDIHVFKEAESGIADWLDDLGDVDLPLRTALEEQSLPRLLNASALFHELHPAHESMPNRGDLADWEQIRERLEGLSRQFPTVNDPLLHDELQHALNCCRFACDTAIMRRGGAPASGLDSIITQYENLWAKRSRLPGLSLSTYYYTSLRAEQERENLA
ncbi:MAG: hypothetical protein Phyf2KO_05170 [Phycisphaerales bacterium]